jgi:hypothetical protein
MSSEAPQTAQTLETEESYSPMKASLHVIPGTRVLIKPISTKGIITAVMIEDISTTYRVVFWNDGQRKVEWLYRCEFEIPDTDADRKRERIEIEVLPPGYVAEFVPGRGLVARKVFEIVDPAK